MTRRQFLKAGGATTTLVLGSGLTWPQAVQAAPQKPSANPRPIPYGMPLRFPNPMIFHVEAPGHPLPNPPFNTNPATNSPATITDFNGFVGLDFNPGTAADGRFWTMAMDPRNVDVPPGSGRAVYQATNLPMPDHHDLASAVRSVPPVPGVVSFHIE